MDLGKNNSQKDPGISAQHQKASLNGKHEPFSSGRPQRPPSFFRQKRGRIYSCPTAVLLPAPFLYAHSPFHSDISLQNLWRRHLAFKVSILCHRAPPGKRNNGETKECQGKSCKKNNPCHNVKSVSAQMFLNIHDELLFMQLTNVLNELYS